jgi:hypothetical protein
MESMNVFSPTPFGRFGGGGGARLAGDGGERLAADAATDLASALVVATRPRGRRAAAAARPRVDGAHERGAAAARAAAGEERAMPAALMARRRRAREWRRRDDETREARTGATSTQISIERSRSLLLLLRDTARASRQRTRPR